MKRFPSLLFFGLLLSAPLLSNGCALIDPEARELEDISKALVPDVNSILRKRGSKLTATKVTLVQKTSIRDVSSLYTGYADLSDGRRVTVRSIYDPAAKEGLTSIHDPAY